MNKSNRILLNWLPSSACRYDRAHVVMIERMVPISGHINLKLLSDTKDYVQAY